MILRGYRPIKVKKYEFPEADVLTLETRDRNLRQQKNQNENQSFEHISVYRVDR